MKPVTVAVLLAATSALGQEPSPRALAGHWFIPALGLDPFPSTSFDDTTGFGLGNAQAPVFDAQGRATGTTREYNLGAFAQSFQFQLGFSRLWAVRASAAGLLFAGRTAPAALVIGATSRALAAAGGTLSFHLSDRAIVSAVVDADYGLSQNINAIRGAIGALLGQVDPGSFYLLRRTKIFDRIGAGHFYFRVEDAAQAFLRRDR